MFNDYPFYLPLLATLTTGVAVILTIRQPDNRLYAVFKISTSFLFVLTALLAPANDLHSWFIFGGLVAHLAGDYLITRSSHNKSALYFRLALLAFFAGHIFYILAFSQFISFSSIHPAPIIVLGLMNLGILFRYRTALARILVPGILYALALTLMSSLALSVLILGGVPPIRAWLLALGGLLYNISDLAVVREMFVSHSRYERAWGLPLYMASQFLLASSLYPFD